MKTQLNLPITLDIDAIIDNIKDNMDSIIPSRLEELNGKQIIFCNDRSLIPTYGWDQDATDEIIINKIEPLNVNVCVVGVDSSCILVGETVDGFIYSAKCCIALAYSGKMITHAKIGPMLFYVKSDCNDTLDACNVQANNYNSVEESKRMIRVRLERMLQYEISRLLSNSIILVDGPLRASPYEAYTLINIIDACNTNNNMLIGLSKSTSFKHLSRIASSLTKQRYPCYTDVTDLIKNNSNCKDNILLLNNVSLLLAKLNSNGLVIRVDIPSMYDISYSLGTLVKNDILHNGYPDTLRIAHHTSVFTSTDVLCLKSFMKSRLSVKEVDGDYARRLLIGRAC